MSKQFYLALSVVFILSVAVSAQQVRDVRSVPHSGAQHVLASHLPTVDEGENQDTLRYEDPVSLPKFAVRPDDWGDKYFDVRFTPLYAPFYLLEAHIAIYDMEGLGGEPGLTMVLFESGDKFGIPGYPTDAVDSVQVPFENLMFSGDSVVWNTIDLRTLQIAFFNSVDFHLAAAPIQSDSLDTLAVLMDNGRYTPTGTRSYTYNDGEWRNLHDDLRMHPYNFAIHAVITPERPVGWGVPEEKSGGRLPSAILLNPAYPNPFNDRTTINFIVAAGQPYSVSLLDRQGRQVALLDRGLGGEARSLVLNGGNLSSGVYFLQVRCPGATQTTELHYLR